MASSKHQINPEKWVDNYSNYLFNYTITRVNDREVAKDLISETFLAGLKSMKNFKGQATERTWLISILKRKIIDYYRKINSKKAQAEIKPDYIQNDREGDWLEEQISNLHEKNAEDQLINSELGMAIYNCLENLNEKHAKIFKMKTIDNIDTDVICNEFNISTSNLWVIIHRARTTLASCLEKNWLK
ncbi:sigma-70 family RNA polymerase sigma factor [Mesonia aquimarina]|uniref:sigma-70 family RNA polymerase sigma factor n=1 Tax=Mesonia aquimarina TaxID=1504967 RepID=UPI000EF57E27|nr:sigma-70 family RNA polymerase sigma factor [Mesonia aquimarina]